MINDDELEAIGLALQEMTREMNGMSLRILNNFRVIVNYIFSLF